MTARTLLATVAVIGLAGSTLAQDPTPAPSPTPAENPATQADPPQTPTTPSPSTLGSPSTTQPTQPVPTTGSPTVSGGGMVYPSQAPVYQNGMWVYPQGTVLQSGYSQPMTYTPQGQAVLQPGTVIYGTPVMSGTTFSYPSSGYVYPTTGYTTAGSTYPMYTTNGYQTLGTGYANLSSYSGGTVSNVVTYPTRTVRRLFRR